MLLNTNTFDKEPPLAFRATSGFRYASCFGQQKSGVACTEFESKCRMRQAVFWFRQVFLSRVGATLLSMAIVQLLSAPASFAQKGDLDYYAPRRTQVEIELFNNVQSHHLPLGRDRTASGDYEAALKEFGFILYYYPNHTPALAGLSELCLKWKSPKCDVVADNIYSKAIARNPEAAQSYVVYAMHLHRKNKLDDAVKSYKRAVELAPNSVNAHYNLGLAYTDLKQYDQANLHAQKSYSLGVTLPGLRTRLEKVGKWNPGARLPEPEAKPAADTPPSATTEKTPG